MNKKIMTFVVAMVLLLGVTLGVTFALMMDNTGTITNTFVAGGFGDLELFETKTIDAQGNTSETPAGATGFTQDFTMFPGNAITKDPYVTFDPDENSGEYVVFVKINAQNWKSDGKDYTYNKGTGDSAVEILSFTVADGWTALDGVADVFYKEMDAEVELEKAAGYIIKGNTVTVNSDATYDDISSFTGASAISLGFSAYAIQTADGMGLDDLWTEVSG